MTAPAPDPIGRHEAPAYEVAPANATEPKVIGATGGATAGVVVVNFILYLIGNWFYGGHDVPMVVAMFVSLVVVSGLAFAGGYFSRHVNRP